MTGKVGDGRWEGGGNGEVVSRKVVMVVTWEKRRGWEGIVKS